jgi:hypothetical protein
MTNPTADRSSNAPSTNFRERKIDILSLAELFSAVLLSVLMLFFLGVRAIHAGPLWRDEAATLQLAQMPALSDVAKNFPHEAFPLPFPLLIRTFAALFGASDASLRGFGLIVGVAILAAAWLNSRAPGGRGPLLFLALFGLNATFITWGTSLRGYGLGCVFLLLTLGLSARAIRQPTTPNAFLATIAAIASTQIMVNAIPVIAAIAVSAFVVLFFQRRFRQAMLVCICAAICGLSFLPYANAYLNADWNVVLKYPATFFSLWEKFQLALGEPSMLAGLFWCAAVLLIITGAICRWWTLRREKAGGEADLLLFLIAVSLLSIFAYCAFLKILSYATRPWYYLPLLCVIAGAIDLISGLLTRVQVIRIARVVLALAALSFLPFTLWKRAHERLTNIDVVAHKLEAEASPHDLIVVNPWHFAPSFYRYYHGATPWITVPTMSEHRIHRYDLMKSKMMELAPLSDVREAIRQTLESDNRVWIVGGARPPDENVPSSLGPAPNPELGWKGYMSFWSIELGSFLNAHVIEGKVVLEPMAGVNSNENVPLLVARGWQD